MDGEDDWHQLISTVASPMGSGIYGATRIPNTGWAQHVDNPDLISVHPSALVDLNNNGAVPNTAQFLRTVRGLSVSLGNGALSLQQQEHDVLQDATESLLGEGSTSMSPATSYWSHLDNVTLDTYGNITNATSSELSAHSVAKIVIISLVVTVLAVLTAGGNLMVMISFKLDKQLQTVSNYFLLSLSVADFFIGVFSMPLYTVYLLMKWPLGPLVCDSWLSMDYTMSNASVANLLLISFDRYFSVTRPLTYRAKRTPRRAAIMISCAWIISALLWTPWIFAWPYIEGERTVPNNECYIQFLDTNQYITVITAIAAFYLPVIIMIVLYFKIYLETEKRNKGLAHLQAAAQISDTRKYLESSDEEACTSLSHRRTDSSPEYEDFEIITDAIHEHRHRRRSCWRKLRHCCRIDSEETGDYADDSSSSDPPGSPTYQCTPSSSQHNIPMRRDQSLHKVDGGVVEGHPNRHHQHHHQNGRHRKSNSSGMMIPLITVGDSTKSTPSATPSTGISGTVSKHSNLTRSTTLESDTPDTVKDPPKSSKKEKSDTYTILIKYPDNSGDACDNKPSIKMLTDSEPDDEPNVTEVSGLTDARGICMNNDDDDEVIDLTRKDAKDQDNTTAEGSPSSTSTTRRLTQTTDNLRMAMQARVAVKLANKMKTQRARKQRIERKQDRKAAKTLSAILLAFIVTWTPYNIFTVIETFCSDSCVNATVYAIGEYCSPFNSLCHYKLLCIPG